MNYAIIISESDPAGKNIKDKLLKLGEFIDSGENFDGFSVYGTTSKIYTLATQHIRTENLQEQIDADFFIFATTHKSKKGTPSLSVHHPGNWFKAEMGGRDKTIPPTHPGVTKRLFTVLNDEAKSLEGYQITLEATHHGPYLTVPSVFIEIGSTEKQWSDDVAGMVIAKTIIRSIQEGPCEGEACFGLGGPHYCNNFNKRILQEDILISHVCPKYMLSEFDENLLSQCITSSVVPIKFAYLDWKGMSGEKQRISKLLDSSNVEIRKIK